MQAFLKPYLSKTAKNALFILLALVSLVLGCLGAKALWKRTHHRYDRPGSGYYYGYVNAHFSVWDDSPYTFHFEGQSKSRWRWVYSTNVFYDNLRFDWTSYDSRNTSTEGKGIISLPSLAYSSTTGTGVLTHATLAQWLIGVTNPNPELARGVDGVFDFIEAAGHGSLPAPNHHGHTFEQPVNVRIQHALLGVGVPEFIYIWIGCWIILVTFGWRKFRK
jgi:hypothetical protein